MRCRETCSECPPLRRQMLQKDRSQAIAPIFGATCRGDLSLSSMAKWATRPDTDDLVDELEDADLAYLTVRGFGPLSVGLLDHCFADDPVHIRSVIEI
jgi:hypothetical protein